MNRIPGVVVGIVKDVEDPKKLGRVRVNFPWLSKENKSAWVRVATFMSGKERGSFFMPELEDEVLVAFDHGKIDHPYVVGHLWNGEDPPPIDGIDTSVRRLRTVSGHVLEFDDRKGQERILMKTKGGQELELVDNQASVTLKTKGGNEITISDAPPEISVKTAAGKVSVQGLTVEIQASAMLKVTAPIAQFSGIVQAQLVQSQAVVSAAYNPGVPGNLLGL